MEIVSAWLMLLSAQDVMGHVNNVTYVRYAESARVNWTRNIGLHIDPANKDKWTNLLSSKGIGLILRSIKVDYKFVRDPTKSPNTQSTNTDPFTAAHDMARQDYRLPKASP